MLQCYKLCYSQITLGTNYLTLADREFAATWPILLQNTDE